METYYLTLHEEANGERYHVWEKRHAGVANFRDIMGVKPAIAGTSHFHIVLVILYNKR